MTRDPLARILTVREALQQLVAAVIKVSDLPDPVPVQVGFVQCAVPRTDYMCSHYTQALEEGNEVRLGTLLTVLLVALHDPFVVRRFRLRSRPAQEAIDQALAALEASSPASETDVRDGVPEKQSYLVKSLSETRQMVEASEESQYLQIGEYDQAMDSLVALDCQGNRYVIDNSSYQQVYGFYQEQTGQGEQAFRTHYWTPSMLGVHLLINEHQDAPKRSCQSCKACPADVYRKVILDDVGYYWLCRSCYQTLAA